MRGDRNEKIYRLFYCNKQVENNIYENKKEQNTGTKTIKRIGKVTYKVVLHFNENATGIMQDKLKRILLREND